MNLPDNTEVTTLRLELGRMTDKANALEAALRKEVLAIVRDGIAEYERLKTDIYRLRHERIRDLNTYGGQQEEIARLKAEVEELQRLLTAATFYNKKGKQP